MSSLSDYLESLKKQEKKKGNTASAAVAPVKTKTSSSPLVHRAIADDFAPVSERINSRTSKKKDKEKWYDNWFQAGAMQDGLTLKNVSKTILGSELDVAQDLLQGGLGIIEGSADFFAANADAFAKSQYYLNGGGGLNVERDKAFESAIEAGKSRLQEFAKKDIINEEAISKFIIRGDYEADSIFADKADQVVQSGGQLLATSALGGAGMPWWMTTGMTSWGSEYENALNQGATHEEANLSGAIAAGAEVLTEKLSGAIKFGGKAADDAVTDLIARSISNKFARYAAKAGLDIVGEGGEEVLTEAIGKFGQWLTYRDDEKLGQVLFSEEALDEYLQAFLGGAAMGGVANIGNTMNAELSGVDAVNGMTKNEQAVVDKVYKDMVAEAEKNGKVPEKQKAKFYDEAKRQLEKGYIPTDVIEEVLGGDTYKAYSDSIYTEERNELKNKLGKEVADLVKNERLAESYNERERRKQKFEADLSQYDAKQQKVVQKAIDSGILNNTNRSHEMVDLIAKVSAEKDIPFDFTNNEKIKGTIFAIDGKDINAYRTKDGITLNVDSPKYLQSTVGHEITHVLEGSELYDSLKNTIVEYAKSKGEYDTRLADLTEMYKDVKDANIEGELVADLVGDYLFQDADFINRLSTENRNVFDKVFDEIKYFCDVVTAGSKEARELEKIKKIFEDAYRSESTSNFNGDVEYSLYSKPSFNKQEWSIVNRRKHSEFDNPKYDLDIDKKWMYANEKGSTVFAIYSKNDVSDPTVLYGSHGLKAEQDYAKLNRFFEEGKLYATNNRTTFDRILNDIKSSKRNAGNGLPSTRNGATTTGDVFSSFGESRSNGQGDNGDGIENLQTGLTENVSEASDDSGASVTFSNDYAFYRNYLKEGDSGEQYSLGDANRRYGEYTTPMKDIALDSDNFVAPSKATEAQDGVIPNGSVVKASDRNNYGIVESYNPETDTYLVNFKSKGGFTATVEFDAEQLTHVPTASEQYHSQPDVEQYEYENAEAVRDATENRLAELAELDLSDPQNADEYNKVLEAWVEAKTKLLELDEKFAEQAESITDADAPPEKKFDAPVKPEPKVAQVLKKPSKKKNRGGLLHAFTNKFVDKGNAVEKLSLDTGNMELQAKWNSALPTNTDSMAQYFMENGTDKVPALKKILNEQNKSGKTHAFNEYMNHLRNVDSMTLQERLNLPNKPVFGNSVTADISRKKVAEWEKKNPEFKRWAQQYYDISNHLLDELVKEGLLTKESADYLRNKYPHYIPLKRAGVTSSDSDVVDIRKAGVGNTIKTATGSNADLEPLGNAMAERIQQHYHAIAKNRFGVELKNTLNSVVEESKNLMKADDFLDAFEGYEQGLLNRGRVNGKPTFTVYENGNRVEFEITDELYDSLEPTKKGASARIPGLSQLSDIRRKLLTTWNPVFSLYRNPVKDLQDVMINSQHPAKTYANIPGAMLQLLTGGEFANEYHKNGGKSNTYYDSQKSRFKFEDNMFKKVFGMPFRAVEAAGEFIEQVPRLAEYMASRKDGRSIERSMLDAARVTTNFAAGGDFTKLINRNGVPFLNASVQGAAQHVRNFRESAKLDGFKGVVKTLSKYVIAGVPAVIFNNLIWDDDEEYEELNEYVKDNYYVVAKTEEGKFIRIPKGRTSAVIQEGLEQMQNLVTGDDEADFNTFFDLFINNIAPNNPLKDNIFAPVVQTISNNAWYSADIVPERLQGLPAEEQFDESTDSLSKWLGEKLKVSPMKVNYLLDQYSGGIGDVVLPMMTPEVESGDDSLVGNLLAPWKKEITTDSVLNNKNPGEFFDLSDKVQARGNSKNATKEEQMQAKYIQTVGYEISDLYAQKRDVQSSDLPAEVKYNQIRKLQMEINDLARNAMKDYSNVSVDGLYSEVGNKRYNYDPENAKWYEIQSKNPDGSDNWYYQKEQEVTKGLGISYKEYWNNREEYNFAYDKPEQYTLAKALGGYDTYKGYTNKLYNFKADYDENGKAISGSKKEKVKDYIFNDLDIDYGEKLILYRSQYDSNADKKAYNYDIVMYLCNRDDVSYQDMVTILKYLDFNVDANGNITW